ncbi:MAG: penicillin-insensitive murein endopeptidase [Nannocystaceae bacterium]|nr:penicillin-insensitive murein endopeptidase [Nannocystaceae bacterium]
MRLRSIVPVAALALVAIGGARLEPVAPPTEGIALATALPGVATLSLATASAATPVAAPTIDAAPVFAAVGPLPPPELPAGATEHAELPPPEEALGLEALPPMGPSLPDELDVVHWTVQQRTRLDEVASNWGMWPEELRELNPTLGEPEWIEAGTALVVHVTDRRKPTQSVGAPNKGHLLRGIPLPEGPHWQLRDHRPRAYGSRTTVRALLDAMRAYGAADPQAPALRIGELSRRSGGRIEPHVSHRSGRDVDIGYVMRGPIGKDERFWRTATPKNLDVPRTWAFVQALLDTGEVQQIFISSKIQKLLAREARKSLPPEQVALIFSAVNRDPTIHTLIRHEHGHRDHMHVRFVCEPGNLRCRTSSVDRD